MKSLGKLATAAAALAGALFLASCDSGSEGGQVTRGADGMPKGDTGWSVTAEDGTFRMARQLDQLSLSYTFEKGANPPAKVEATVEPCLNGRGSQNVRRSYTPQTSDDVSRLAEIREQIDSAVSELSARCTIPDEVTGKIGNGFDGAFFNSAKERRSLSAS